MFIKIIHKFVSLAQLDSERWKRRKSSCVWIHVSAQFAVLKCVEMSEGENEKILPSVDEEL